ncbi:MAG: hemolysin III family protein [Piscinibacter sp.]|nr:hemolysin III family protein [Piscinibacter sp.]
MDLRCTPALRPALADRAQSRAEEWANTLSHGLGIALALLAWPWLADAAQRQSGTPGVVGVALFSASMLLQYLASTVYHALPHGRAKQWARTVDHAAIYLFIAGSSSPFTLGILQGAAGVATCALVWSLALWGASLKLRRRLTNRRLSTGLYILLGWLALLAAWPGLRGLDPTALWWLLGGGAAYLLGTAFFVFDASLRFGHFVWHLFVLAGSGCHVCAAVWPALG